MHTFKMSLMVVMCCALMMAQDKPATTTAGKAPVKAGAATGKAPATKKTPGFDINAMDKTVDPCTNFYEFSCGNWLKHNPVPSDRSRWGRFNELADRNNDILRGILEAAEKGGDKRDATDQKIGDFYGACMDEGTINKKGTEP